MVNTSAEILFFCVKSGSFVSPGYGSVSALLSRQSWAHRSETINKAIQIISNSCRCGLLIRSRTVQIFFSKPAGFVWSLADLSSRLQIVSLKYRRLIWDAVEVFWGFFWTAVIFRQVRARPHQRALCCDTWGSSCQGREATWFTGLNATVSAVILIVCPLRVSVYRRFAEVCYFPTFSYPKTQAGFTFARIRRCQWKVFYEGILH